MGGYEYDEFSKFFHFPEEMSKDTKKKAITKVLNEKRCFIIPGIVPGSSIFPNIKAGIQMNGDFKLFKDLKEESYQLKPFGQEYYEALNTSLAFQTKTLFDRLSTQKGDNVFLSRAY